MTNLGLKELVFHGLERAGSIRIIDNLFQSIRGLELESVGNIYIAAHPELKELSFPKLKDVTSGFEVVNNNKNLQVSVSLLTLTIVVNASLTEAFIVDIGLGDDFSKPSHLNSSSIFSSSSTRCYW